MNFLLFFGAGVVPLALLILEGRRPHRRHLFLRGAATVGAVIALGMLAAMPARQENAPSGPDEAALWTRGASQSPDHVRYPLTFALPEATATAPAGAMPIPDVGTLRRRFQNVHTLHLFGDGLDPAELYELAGMHVIPCEASPGSATTPTVDFLDCPGELSLGETLTVSGRVVGLVPGANVPISLEGPDGKETEGSAGPADEHGEAVFDLRADPLPASGRYEWRLRAGATDEQLGVSIVPPVLPRVLVLEASPHFETAALRRWYMESAGTMTVRTQVGKALFRYAAAGADAGPFQTVDAPLLARFDLVLADREALLTLGPEEVTALATDIHDHGLGLLVRQGETLLFKEVTPTSSVLSSLLPWKLIAAKAASSEEERLVRLRWRGPAIFPDVPLTSKPVSFGLGANQWSIVEDHQGRTMVATASLGRGQTALTLVGDTSRFLRENAPVAFSSYWSFLFSSLACPQAAERGRWRLANAARCPVFVDHPLTLRWTGPAQASPGHTTVTQVRDGKFVPLPLAQSAADPDQWQGTFWPREAGWHRITSGVGSDGLDFYVYPADAWPELQATTRRAAATRFALESPAGTGTAAPRQTRTSVASAGWFALLVFAVGYLWLERRFAGTV